MEQRLRHHETRHVAVTAREWLTPHMVRLTLSGADLRGIRVRPAQDIELLLEDRERRVKRRYTIRRPRPDVGELDIDVLMHDGGGPGSRWASRAAVGDAVEFIGPKGKLELLEADWHLFVGDEAALPAIAELTEALGADATTVVLAEVGDPSDELPIAATRLHWVYRGGAEPGKADLLAAAMDELGPSAVLGRAYLLGESRVMSSLRGRLAQLGIPGERAFVKGYWNRDRDAGVSAFADAIRGRGDR
jgi:NADPH-dependent ferric siderophore reductase